jgi:hypothetical protein
VPSGDVASAIPLRRGRTRRLEAAEAGPSLIDGLDDRGVDPGIHATIVSVDDYQREFLRQTPTTHSRAVPKTSRQAQPRVAGSHRSQPRRLAPYNRQALGVHAGMGLVGPHP